MANRSAPDGNRGTHRAPSNPTHRPVPGISRRPVGPVVPSGATNLPVSGRPVTPIITPVPRPSGRPIADLRPPIEPTASPIIPNVASLVGAPRLPGTPKPDPHPFRPAHRIRHHPNLVVETNATTLRSLGANLRRPIRLVYRLPYQMRTLPIIARTGSAHPHLPLLDGPSTSPGTPPTPLRTTREWIRFEITPTATVH